MEIRGKRILVTGASGGLGQAITRRLAREGAALVVSARNEATLEALAADTGAEVVVADLASRRDVERLAARMSDLDVLVANAGVGQTIPLPEVTDDDVDAVIDVNLRSPVVLATAFAKAHLLDETPGQIVFVGSLSGLAASPESRLYNATKFGLRGYSLALRQDLEDHRIGVTHLAPGFIRDAGMFHDGSIELPKGVRTKSPGDVADAVVKAIRSNPAEVFAAPIELRLGATLATVAPGLSARVQKMFDAAGRQTRSAEQGAR